MNENLGIRYFKNFNNPDVSVKTNLENALKYKQELLNTK